MLPLSDTDWVAIAFLVFVGLLIWKKVPAMVLGALDDKADAIRNELEEAARIRSEAQALLAKYQKAQAEAEKEAEAIVEQASKEATALAEQTRVQLEELAERRTKLVEQKIAQAEAQAVAEVRNVAINAAVSASRSVVTGSMTGDKAASLIDNGIASIKDNLH
ncbi:MAG: F0F1 ATP synthase subunit B [Alphaproteobacteria bacterium]